MNVKGQLFGVKIHYGTAGPNNPQVEFFIENDGTFIETDFAFAADWLDDLINVAKKTKNLINHQRELQL